MLVREGVGLEILCGVDWSERHHDVALVDQDGRLVVKRRISDDVAGFTELTALLAEHAGQGGQRVDVAIETRRGLLVAGLRAAGHRVYAINPKAVDRYRDRHQVSRAKSDAGDARVLADTLRTDRDRHRPLPVDSELGQALSVLARAPSGRGVGLCPGRQPAPVDVARVLPCRLGGVSELGYPHRTGRARRRSDPDGGSEAVASRSH